MAGAVDMVEVEAVVSTEVGVAFMEAASAAVDFVAAWAARASRAAAIEAAMAGATAEPTVEDTATAVMVGMAATADTVTTITDQVL
jgi:hypothetical protein